MGQIIGDALQAAAEHDWDRLKLLVHPYAHWSTGDGFTMRGRTNVLRWLASRNDPLEAPATAELCDGQI